MPDDRPHTLTGAERLGDLEAWDSLSTVVFIATVDKKFNVPLAGSRVSRCTTVADLCTLLEEAMVGHARDHRPFSITQTVSNIFKPPITR